MSFKSEIKEYLLATNRENIKSLLAYMDKNGFYTAPCSTQYHLCREGGLAEHSLNVYLTMVKFYNAQTDFILPLDSSIEVVALLHDLGKMGHHGKSNYVQNFLRDGSISKTKPYETNKNLLGVPHEVESIVIAERFITLTEEEEYAILYHNGLYGDFKYEINGKERPLQMLLHFADLWCSRMEE